MASQQVIAALEDLHRELEKIEPAIKHVETAQKVTDIVKDIPQKHIELLKEVKANDAIHKGELKNLFASEISGLTEETKNLQKTTNEVLQNTIVEQEALSKLRNEVKNFHERVASINFPERLDKVDANISGIMAAVQSVQSRLDNIERNITDRLKDLSERQKEAQKAIVHSIIAATKKQQQLTFVTWVLIAIGIIIGLVL